MYGVITYISTSDEFYFKSYASTIIRHFLKPFFFVCFSKYSVYYVVVNDELVSGAWLAALQKRLPLLRPSTAHTAFCTWLSACPLSYSPYLFGDSGPFAPLLHHSHAAFIIRQLNYITRQRRDKCLALPCEYYAITSKEQTNMQPVKQANNQPSQATRENQQKKGQCFNCNKPGHV